MQFSKSQLHVSDVAIPYGPVELKGELTVPAGAGGLVVFAHGSGSSRHSPRNQAVAAVLQDEGLATLLFDLLTEEEERLEYYTRHLRFDISLLADRLGGVTNWVSEQEAAHNLNVGYFGSSTGAAAALVATARLGDKIGAVVSRGGRPDLAGAALEKVKAPTLLIVGGEDAPVIDLNEQARERMRCKRILTIVPGATHLFEEPGAMEKVSRLAAEWFVKYLQPLKTA